MSLILENFDEFWINRAFNAGDVFWLALRGLNNLAEQRELLSCVDGLRSEVQDSAARVWSPEQILNILQNLLQRVAT